MCFNWLRWRLALISFEQQRAQPGRIETEEEERGRSSVNFSCPGSLSEDNNGSHVWRGAFPPPEPRVLTAAATGGDFQPPAPLMSEQQVPVLTLHLRWEQSLVLLGLRSLR
ncbi:unnamed protein product [Pleuronectes platessa]|uniref:Uncharacterized protein n=1 Tax=Pleuronectes platessa TaxID=8262 RepID=A0A9N7V557_PLEPL|nr:unnamed protein product [Pleuronectes platessa]